MLFYLLSVYLIASIPIDYLLVKRRMGKNIRKEGDKKTSAANIIRNVGWRTGVVCGVLDFFKGFLAVYLAQCFGFSLEVQVAAAILVVTGQLFPLFLKFWGGTGWVAFLGSLLLLAPKMALGVVMVRALTELVVERFELLPEGESLGISFSLLLVVVWGFLTQYPIGILGIAVFVLIHLARLLGTPGSLRKIGSKKTLLLGLLSHQGLEKG